MNLQTSVVLNNFICLLSACAGEVLGRMNGVEQVSWTALTASSLGGALFGVVAASLCWLRRGRRSRTVSGHGAKKIKVYHTPTFRSARVAWMIAGKTHLCRQSPRRCIAGADPELWKGVGQGSAERSPHKLVMYFKSYAERTQSNFFGT